MRRTNENDPSTNANKEGTQLPDIANNHHVDDSTNNDNDNSGCGCSSNNTDNNEGHGGAQRGINKDGGGTNDTPERYQGLGRYPKG